MSEKKSEPALVEIPKEILDSQNGTITISHAQAKQLLKATRPKREMTEAQKAATQRLIERNRERWATIKAEKEKVVKDSMAQVEEIATKQKEEHKKNNVTIRVLPKKQVAPRGTPATKKKAPVEDVTSEEYDEEDEESEESEPEEVIVKKKTKRTAVAVKPKEILRKTELLKQIDSVLTPNPQQTRYAALLSKMF